MTTSATDERVSGLPTNLEEATRSSGEMQTKASSHSQTVIPKDNSESVVLDLMAADVLAMCKVRGWSLHWTHRGAYLHLESSELIEAVRGKRGSVVDEAGDVLIVLMSITENAGIPFSEVVGAATIKLDGLFTKPRYAGEEWQPITQASASASAQTTTVPDHSQASSLESRLKAEEAIRPLFADVSVIRTAIMDALDSESIWDFDDKDVLTDEEATEERMKFADCIEKRIRELQSPPFNLGTKLENYCPRHIRARLPEATAAVCADCTTERLEKRRINDPD